MFVLRANSRLVSFISSPSQGPVPCEGAALCHIIPLVLTFRLCQIKDVSISATSPAGSPCEQCDNCGRTPPTNGHIAPMNITGSTSAYGPGRGSSGSPLALVSSVNDTPGSIPSRVDCRCLTDRHRHGPYRQTDNCTGWRLRKEHPTANIKFINDSLTSCKFNMDVLAQLSY